MSAKRGHVAPSQNATRLRIIAAARQAIARRGIARFTHRAVASEGAIPLAALTYHFESKEALIAEVSAAILADYIADFAQLAKSLDDGLADRVVFERLTTSIVAEATSRHREGTMAWLEIMLHRGRSAEASADARQWFAKLQEIWTGIAQSCALDKAGLRARSAIDEATGLMLIGIGLGSDKSRMLSILREGVDPASLWSGEDLAPRDPGLGKRPWPRPATKSEQTRALIVQSAVDCCVEEGPQHVGYRTIAQRSALSESAPYYYYPKIAELLRDAQETLFKHSKQRFRAQLGDAVMTDVDGLADLTAAILQNEVTQYARHNLANFAFWLEAGREANLRPVVHKAVMDQQDAWLKRFTQVGLEPTPLDAMRTQARFAGMCLRLVSTGATMADIVEARGDLRSVISSQARAEA